MEQLGGFFCLELKRSASPVCCLGISPGTTPAIYFLCRGVRGPVDYRHRNPCGGCSDAHADARRRTGGAALRSPDQGGE